MDKMNKYNENVIPECTSMARFFPKLANKRGNLLALTYLMIVVLVLLAAGVVIVSFNERNFTNRQRMQMQALHLAEAGLEKAMYDLEADFSSDTSWTDGTINGMAAGPDTNNFYTLPYPSTTLGNGTFAVELKNVTGYARHMWIRSTGTVGEVTQTIEAYVKMRSSSPWDNAIFAGSGGVGALINGNVNVRGSVHLLGDNLTSSDIALDMGGGASIGNNYSDMPSSLSDKVPALAQSIFNGEIVSSLEAELRVKHGRVSLGGASTAGFANATGNAYKETLDGSYVTDGFTGSGGAGSVYSDNGTSNGYDMGNSISLPLLSSAYGGYASYQAYLRANALVINNSSDLAQLNNVTPNSNFTMSSAKGSITMDGNGNMTISGIVYVEGGDINFNKQGSDNTIIYSGSGSILTTGNVGLDINLITNGNNSYPTNIIGFMTPNNITMNAASIDVMGLFYAQNTITVQKQTNVVGSLVSNNFNMGTNVPNVYYVPDIADHLPPGMITTTPVWRMVYVSWRKL